MYKAPADLQITQIKRAMDLCSGLSEHKIAEGGMSNSLLVGEKIKKGKNIGITDQDAEDTGKEIAVNFWNSLLLQQYNQDKYCWTNRASNTI